MRLLVCVGVHAHIGVSQFGKIPTDSRTAFRISDVEIKYSSVLHGVDLVGRNKHILSTT